MKPTLASIVFALTCLSSATRAQSVLKTYAGSPSDEFGAAVHWTADQNGDGYPDVLVGAPGFNSGRGYIRALSGKFMVTGTGSAVLWTLMPTVNAGARFGSSIIEVATLTGNAATDYVVGAPGYIASGSTTTGALLLIDGSTHTVASTITGDNDTRLGQRLVAVGDQDGDGKIDVAASALNVVATNQNSKVNVIPGSSFTSGTHTLASVAHSSKNVGWHDYGAALESGFDLDGDGRFDLAVGIPTFGFSFPEAGYIEIVKADSSFGLLSAYTTLVAGEHFGSSIDAKRDFDGDGVNDFVVGAPNSPGSFSTFTTELGRVLVLSGAKMRANTLPFEIYTLTTPSNTILNTHFGAAVCASGDLNGDGVSEIVVGAPDFTSGFPSVNRGFAAIFSGATGTKLATLVGSGADHLGDVLAAGLLDINGDGFLDFTVAGSLSDNSTVDCGNVDFCSLFPTTTSTYCTAKINSQGCAPLMAASGSASASSLSPFTITCSNAINQVSGLYFYSHAPKSAPFQGGTQCVQSPIRRTNVLTSGGNTSGTDCTGAFSFDFNARIRSGVDATLIAGAEVFVQCWSRDPASPSTTSLSNALRFLINP